MIFLSTDELQELTGRRSNAGWIRWLTKNRWNFAVRADGKPVVAIAEMERHLCGPRAKAVGAEPNLSGLDAL